MIAEVLADTNATDDVINGLCREFENDNYSFNELKFKRFIRDRRNK